MKFVRFIILTVIVLFTVAPFIPLPASAACCVCGKYQAISLGGFDVDKPLERIDACFAPGRGIQQNDCDDIKLNGAIGVSSTLQDGTKTICHWYADKTCEQATCPSINTGDALKAISNNVLDIKSVKRDVIRFIPQVSIPGTDFQARKSIDIKPETIAQYIAGIYYFVVATVGLLAVIGIMIGGFQYLMAAGSSEGISSAKSSITSAITGLVIALTSYVLFSTINPNLVDFSKGIQQLTDVESQQAQINSNLGVGGCKETEQAADLLLINTGVFAGSPIKVSSGVESPARVRADIVARLNDARLTSWIKTLGSQARLVINSAYRTQENQTRLYACYTKSMDHACPYNCASCNEAAEPSCDAPHQTGYAIDVCLENAGAANDAACGSQNTLNQPTGLAKDLQQKMDEVGFGRYCKEWWHFESPVFTQHSAWCDPGIYDIAQAGSGSGGSGDSDCATLGGSCSKFVCTQGAVPGGECSAAGDGSKQACCKP